MAKFVLALPRDIQVLAAPTATGNVSAPVKARQATTCSTTSYLFPPVTWLLL